MLKAIFIALMIAGGILLHSCTDTGKREYGNSNQKGFEKPGYAFYRGVLGVDSVSLDLVIEPGVEQQIQLSGCLHLKDGKGPVYLFSGLLQPGDSIWKLETEEPGSGNGTALMQMDSDGSLKGLFTSLRGKNQRFQLVLSKPEGIKFESLITDSTYAAIEKQPEPRARFAYHFLKPLEAPWLQDSLLYFLFGDSLCRLDKLNPEKIFERSAREFVNSYRSDISELAGDSAEGESFDYSRIFSMEVFLNTRDLLSISLNEYAYYGGAHGLLTSRCMSFDMKAKKRIRLEDVFIPGFREVLREELTMAAKTKYDLNKLSDLFFEDQIEPGANFYLLKNGICFSYYPYEIAPYVVGEPSFYLPFSRLQKILKK